MVATKAHIMSYRIISYRIVSYRIEKNQRGGSGGRGQPHGYERVKGPKSEQVK